MIMMLGIQLMWIYCQRNLKNQQKWIVKKKTLKNINQQQNSSQRWQKCSQITNNELFKQPEFQSAINKYIECIKELNQKQSLYEEQKELLIIIYSSRAYKKQVNRMKHQKIELIIMYLNWNKTNHSTQKKY
ncbi:unnamed protein product [Paramecium pentaurelia]|uniref:Uncharacterized protein n=1 Tax=Paramecium pentaurelia TaxID=43138 RepID=A0A8S1TLT9_9CILI|nr:unnamed protein product [Paramecium pentaurelia]